MTDAENVVLDEPVAANDADVPGSPVEGQDGGKRHRKGRKGSKKRRGSSKSSSKSSRKGSRKG